MNIEHWVDRNKHYRYVNDDTTCIVSTEGDKVWIDIFPRYTFHPPHCITQEYLRKLAFRYQEMAEFLNTVIQNET